MPRRNLILIHRGREYEQDFKEIAQKIIAIDKGINVITLSPTAAQLPALAWTWPTLVVALISHYALQVRRGTVLRNSQIEKLDQYEIFRKSGIPTPPTLPFRFGMMLDPLLFGEFVLIKPMDLIQTSKGHGVQLFRRHRLERLQPSYFPPDHPIHKARNGYLVQRFIDTGPHPSFYRVQTFFGRVIYSWESILTAQRCPLDAPDSEIEGTKIVSQGGEKERKFATEPDVLRLAENLHAQLPDIPILATDVLREESTRQLYVLECNPGGNTWHFSSPRGEVVRLGIGNAKVNGAARANQIARRILIDQYGAFDIVARALVDKTHRLAS